MLKQLFSLCCLLIFLPLGSQDLRTYIEAGLQSNSQLQTQALRYDVAVQALEVAKKLRSVNVDFNPTYTLAFGGRRIDLPVGDLLNPVYGTLNELTASEQFPSIENASELLNPNNFYDVKLRATYPIINRSIDLNEEIKVAEVSIANYQVEQYRQRLIADISTAYYDYQMTLSAIDIYREAATLIDESIRVNQGLYNNDKVLWIDVLSAKDDSVQLAKDIRNAYLMADQAAAYLNFLVNRPLTDPVPVDVTTQGTPSVPNEATAATRPEVRQLDQLAVIQAKLKELATAEVGPQLNVFADVGVQDFGLNLDGQSPYVFGGVAFSVNVFNGGQTKAKLQLADVQLQEIQAQKAQLLQSIALETFTLQKSIASALNDYQAFSSNIDVLQRQYNQENKRYRTGTQNYIEVQNARTSLVRAQLQRNISRFETWKLVAQYERVLATNNNN
ncbi:MAG: TolC family protein [Bacteroidota bacterium]